MKKITLFTVLIISLVLAFVSCTDGDGAPTGMKLVKGGEDVGYSFYVPSEWTVSNQGVVARAHVSSVDTTSVSVVEIATPEDDALTAEAALVDYFRADIPNFPYEITLTANGDTCTFGNVDIAYKFVYTFKYQNINYKAMQILATYGTRSYIFTYQSSGELMREDTTYFDYYYDMVDKIIKEFKFTDKTVGTESAPEILDGYYLASDKKLSGFELYAPANSRCEYSGGMVSIRLNESANISLAKATDTGGSVKVYYETRRDQLKSFVKDYNEIEINKTEGVKLGNLTTCASYEYSYTYNGQEYHVYQIMGVDSFSGYVFTYTAKADAYASNLEAVMDIIEKVVF